MSANKYANLPDIDTAPDIYETDDVFPSATANKGDSSDDDAAAPARRGRGTEPSAAREELDATNLVGTEEATKKFRKAERRRDHQRTHYTYPRSSHSPSRSHSRSHSRPRPLAARLHALQAELASLEAEVADPSNPLLRAQDAGDAGALLRGLVDVRGRLEKIRSGREGRGRLVGVVLGEGEEGKEEDDVHEDKEVRKKDSKGKNGQPEVRSVVEMDRRVGELEKLIGSSSTTLDETSPLPPPLLPLISRLSTQLTLLTQPRHIDSISRRLKLLLSDLDRASQQSASSAHRRQASQPGASPVASTTADQLLPLLTRLSPTLPHIPHILARLRTLAALHASAGEFSRALSALEEEQRRVHGALAELGGAVDSVEKSLEENRGVVGANVKGLEGRVDGLVKRLEEMGR